MQHAGAIQGPTKKEFYYIFKPKFGMHISKNLKFHFRMF